MISSELRRQIGFNVPNTVRGMLAVAIAVLLVGCGSTLPTMSPAATSAPLPPTTSTSTSVPISTLHQITGVRTDSSGIGLVIIYSGGDCDSEARVDLVETPSTISIEIRSDVTASMCAAVGYSRTLSVELEGPVGARTISSGGTTMIPFDGATLLQPGYLPSGFVLRDESGLTAAPGRVGGLTDRWTREFTDRSGSADGCGAGLGSLFIAQGSTPDAGGPLIGVIVGQRTVGGTPADLVEERQGAEVTRRALRWTTATGSLEVAAIGSCHGDQLLAEAELLAVAGSLGPL